jgi:hypothetical protein
VVRFEGLPGEFSQHDFGQVDVRFLDGSTRRVQAESAEHKNFGQPVVSDATAAADEEPITPAQAAARFQIPEYLLRRACLDGRLEHLRVVNALWLSPPAVALFAAS